MEWIECVTTQQVNGVFGLILGNGLDVASQSLVEDVSVCMGLVSELGQA